MSGSVWRTEAYRREYEWLVKNLHPPSARTKAFSQMMISEDHMISLIDAAGDRIRHNEMLLGFLRQREDAYPCLVDIVMGQENTDVAERLDPSRQSSQNSTRVSAVQPEAIRQPKHVYPLDTPANDSKSGSNPTHPQTPQGGESQYIQQNPRATHSTQSTAPEPSIGVRQIKQQIPQETTTNSTCEFCEENPPKWSCQQCVSAPVLCQGCDLKLHKMEARAKHIRQPLSPRAHSGVQNQKTLTIGLQKLLKRSILGAPFKIDQLIMHKIDSRTGSFNENTLVSEGAVRELLAQRGHSLRHFLRNDYLKGQSVTTIGLYGNLALIRDWLRNIRVLREPEGSHLVNDSDPGIHCISNGTEVQFLVLIPPADAFTDVTSTNRCCNLVRYLQELSDNMVTFFSESDLKMFSSTPFAFANVQRTISRKVEYHKGSDEIRSTPGFTLRLDSKSVNELASVSDIHLCHSSGICSFGVGMHVPKGRRKLYVEQLYKYHPLNSELRKMTPSSNHVPTVEVHPSKSNIPLVLGKHHLLRVYNLQNGKVLAILREVGASKQESTAIHLLPERDYVDSDNLDTSPFTVKGQVSLVDFNECSRLVAFCVTGPQQQVRVYKFQGDWKEWNEYCKMDLRPSQASLQVQDLLILPGRDESDQEKLCVIDQQGKGTLFNLRSQSESRGPFRIDKPVKAALATLDGVFLLTFSTAGNSITLNAYSVESREKVTSFPLDSDRFPASCVKTLRVVRFEHNMFLVGFNQWKQSIFSVVLHTLSVRGGVRVVDGSSKPPTSPTAAVKRVPNYLDYLYYGYEKFCLTPCLPTGQLKVFLHCVLADSTQQMDIMTPQEYLSELFNNLQKRTCKNVQRAYPFQGMVEVTRFSESADLRLGLQSRPMTDWLRRLVCLVPIQIARAESGVFKILANGIYTGKVIGKDTLDVIDKIEFGLYEEVLKNWKGPVKVVTSMGKQSSGKSYMLNHLTGSLFDASGGRCTDGIWMTIQQTEDCLYVVLDFEGLGSRERGGQDDVLLSVVNAAISGLTIFKVDNRFDTDIEETLKRIQTGVDWIREDVSSDKLLRGTIVFNIKDVSTDAVPDVQYHFDKMISNMCQGDPNNFVTKMYKERYSVQAVPPFRTNEYQRELCKIGNWLRGVETPIFQSGDDFAEIMKMLMAKVNHQDWLPFDQTMVRIRVERIKRQLDLAVEKGQGSINSEPGSLSLASGESVADEEIIAVGGLSFPALPDEGLSLPIRPATEKSWVLRLANLAKRFSSVFGKKRNGGDLNNAKKWTNGFQDFLRAVVGRRKARIKKWQESYFRPKENSTFVFNLRRDIDTRMEDMEKQLELCRDLECQHCHYPCLMPKYHTSPHSCFGNHRCYIACYHCGDTAEGTLEEPEGSTAWASMDEEECTSSMPSLRLTLDTDSVFAIHPVKGRLDSSWQCREVAGHADKHNCKIRKHTCGEECHLIRWDKCAKTCQLPRDHHISQPHQCTSDKHICVGVCALDGCKARCTMSYTGEPHRHFCGVNRCQKECEFPGCQENCKIQDHFHGTNGHVVQHFCTKPYHVCVEVCTKPGNCMVLDEGMLEQTKISKIKKAHTGQVIRYDWYQEYNGRKIQCGVKIGSGSTSHSGPHACKQLRHTCTRTCTNCGYFCKEEIGHHSRCSIVHGNMRHTMAILPGGGTFHVGGHEFTESDTGESEVCTLYCRRMGRGHTHFRFCKEPFGRSQCGDLPGIRHVDQRIGPEESRPKDECTHEAFWREQDIADPCPNANFNKCPYQCRLPAPHGRARTSYCSLPLWHADATENEERTATAGYFDNGHHLMCEHVGYEPIHHILVLSQSDSMRTGDHKPDIDSEYYSSHPSRLGAVLDASLHYLQARRDFGTQDVVSVVGFNTEAVEVFSGHRLDPQSLVKLLADKLKPGGCTDYSKAIDLADILLKRNETFDTIVRNAVIIFLSDGQCNTNLEKTIPSLERLLRGRSDRKKSPVRLHTVKFGKDARGNDLLKEMADTAKFRHLHHFSRQSSFEHKVSSIQLTVHFESIADTMNRAGFMPV